MKRKEWIVILWLVSLGVAAAFAADQSRPPAAIQPTLRHSTTEAEIESSLKGSELLHTIYLANHAKEKESIPLLKKAYQQAIKSTAEQINLSPAPLRRAALHWAVLGSLQAKPGKQLESYLQLAEALIAGGADVNAQDFTGITALDMQDFAEDDDMGDLLIEYGAQRNLGTNVAEEVVPLLQSMTTLADEKNNSRLREELYSDLPLGSEISIRLLDQVSSNRSRPGDIVQAVTIAPVMLGNRVTLPAGTVIEGIVASAIPAGDRYKRAKLAIIFRHALHENGERSTLYARLIDVDNARETIEPNTAIGMAFPRSKLDKIGWGTRIAGFAYPGLGYAVEVATWGYSEELKREIQYNEGVDMTLAVTLPSRMKQIPVTPPPPSFAHIEELEKLVNALPRRNANIEGKNADVTNVIFIGTKQEVIEAFISSGWLEARDLSTSSAMKTFAATAFERGYSEAPLSNLYLESKLPELEFEKQNNTFAKRHHLRIYQRGETFAGHPIWVGAATHDIGIRALAEGTKWTHAVDPHIDRERNKIGIDLMFGEKVQGITLVERPNMPSSNKSIAGHYLMTDGQVLVIGLESTKGLLHKRQEWDASIAIPPDPKLAEVHE